MANLSTKIVSIVLLMAAIIGCTKEDITPDPPSNDPVFGVSGTIDNQDFELTAGENNSFMHTNIVNLNGVDHYRGALINGDNKLQISISDGILDIPDVNTDIMSAGDIDIAPNHNGDALAVLSEDLFSNNDYIEEVTWTIDGALQNESTVYITEPGKYEICADILFSDGYTGSTCNTILIGYQKNVNPILKYIVGQNDQIIGFVESPNNDISSIKWYKNDVQVFEGITFNDTSSQMNRYALKARIEFMNGSIREREIWVNRMNTNYKIEDISTLENQSSLSWDNKATVEVDLNGVKYVSAPTEENHKITVTNSWNYGTNEEGDQVTFIEGHLYSTFINLSNGALIEGTFELRFGLAH